MTSMQRIHRAGQGIDPGWDERDVERVWRGLKRKRRRRAVAAVAGASAAGIVVWALLVVPGRDLAVGPADRPPPPARRDETVRFADGSTAVPSGGHEVSLAVVEDTPERVVVALTKGGARFDVLPRRDRVFAVQAGAVTVSVLGTAFSVERVADRVGVVVTRGAVQVDWGAGARRLAAGDDGWFPPLVVSPSAGDEDAHTAAREIPAKDATTVRHKRNPARVSDEDGATTPSPPPPPTAPFIPPVPDAAKLLADADRARLAGRFEEGASLLQRLVREHPDDPRAPLAAFSLGRLLLGELRRPADAARAFARTRTLEPNGPLAREALAREAEAWARAGDADRARAREAEYRAQTRADGGP